MKKIILVLGLIIVLTPFIGNTMGIAINKTQENTTVININATQFNKLVLANKGVVLDVRTPEEWAEGTILGAEKINFYDDNFAQQVERLDKNTPVLVYCRSGKRSSNAAEILKNKGFTKVFNLTGGINSWKENGFEVVK